MRTVVLIALFCLRFASAVETLCRDGVCPDGRACNRTVACNATAAAQLHRAAVTFRDTLSTSPAHLATVLHQPADAPHLLSSAVAFSLRTFIPNALLVYAHDGRGNFLQFELKAGQISCKYNDFVYVLSFIIPVRVDDGLWHHFRMRNKTCYLDNRTFPNTGPPIKRVFSILKLPYVLRRNEEVRPLPHSASTPAALAFVSVIIGGLDRRMGLLPAFVGCLARLSIGGRSVRLRGDDPRSPRVVSGCSAGCGPGICLNKGRCMEEWSGAFSCDCRYTWFSGRRCEHDIGRFLYGDGGFVVMLPSPTAMSVTSGKLVLRSAPRAGEVILHLQRLFQNVVLFSPSKNELSLVIQRDGINNKTYGRIDVSLHGLKRPYKVFFSLWSYTKAIKLQINERVSELASFARRRRTFIDRVIVGDTTALKQVAIGGLNASRLRPLRGCVQNLQIFFEDTQAPLEFSLRGDFTIGKERLKLTRLSAKNVSFCSGMLLPNEVSGNASLENATYSATVEPVKSIDLSEQENSIVIFWVIIVAVGAVMILSILVFGIIYGYYACEKRTIREKADKRTYRKVSSLTPDSVCNSSANPPPSHTVTSNSNSSTLRPSYKPYSLPYKPAYVATSLILREGKHMADEESDPELGESGTHHLV